MLPCGLWHWKRQEDSRETIVLTQESNFFTEWPHQTPCAQILAFRPQENLKCRCGILQVCVPRIGEHRRMYIWDPWFHLGDSSFSKSQAKGFLGTFRLRFLHLFHPLFVACGSNCTLSQNHTPAFCLSALDFGSPLYKNIWKYFSCWSNWLGWSLMSPVLISDKPFLVVKWCFCFVLWVFFFLYLHTIHCFESYVPLEGRARYRETNQATFSIFYFIVKSTFIEIIWVKTYIKSYVCIFYLFRYHKARYMLYQGRLFAWEYALILILRQQGRCYVFNWLPQPF